MVVHMGNSRAGITLLILFAALFLAVPVSTTAQSTEPIQERVKVVGHLALPKMHVNQMFLQQRGVHYYLYLHRPTKQVFALVDVTKPDKPVLLERAALNEGPGAQVEMAKSEAVLAVSVAPEVPAGASGAASAAAQAPEVKLPTETVRLIDLSDPKNPKVIKEFTGVTSMVPDDSRQLIYIVNSEGLWVVSHRQEHPIQYCNSETALMIQANCQ
jgi:hypothetical protein